MASYIEGVGWTDEEGNPTGAPGSLAMQNADFPAWQGEPASIGPTGVAPQPEPDSRAQKPGESMTDWLTRLQIMDLEEEKAFNDQMRPWTLKEMGLIEDSASPGGFRQLTEDERINGIAGNPVYTGMTQAEKDAYQTEKLLAERQNKAATGTLEIPSYVTNEIDRQRTVNDNLLSQRLGPKGAHVSMPGLASRNTFDTNAALTKNAYNFGQESQGMGLLGGYNNYLASQQGRNLNTFGIVQNGGMGLLPMYQSTIQPYTFGQQLRDEKEQMGVNRNRAYLHGGMGLLGSAASAYVTGGMA